MNNTFTDYGLGHHLGESIQGIRDIIDMLNAPILANCVAARKMLNKGQRHAYIRIISLVKKAKPEIFFIDGEELLGKHSFYCALCGKVHNLNLIILPIA